MTEQKYQCPVCHKWYTWDGNFCGLILIYEGDQPFVCNNCEAEGERLNWLRRMYGAGTGQPIGILSADDLPQLNEPET